MFCFGVFLSRSSCFCLYLLELFLGNNNTNKITTTNNTQPSINNNNANIGHPPAHHPTANKYLSGSGWMRCMLFVLGVSRRLFVVVLVTWVCSLIHATYLNYWTTTTHNTQQHTRANQQHNNKPSSKVNNTHTHIGHPAHHPTANKYLSGSGWMRYIFVFVVFVSKVVCCYVVLLCCCVVASLGKLLHVQAT